MNPILIIEDEARTAQHVQKGLQEHGYTTEWAPDGQAGMDRLEQGTYELVILDVMLPKHDGWDVLAWMRNRFLTVPVIMLTAQNDVNNRIKGLKVGADDYLTKPFAFAELLARIEAILRRTRTVVPRDVLTLGDLSVHLTTQRVTRANTPLELAPKEFQLLCVLMEKTGRFVSRQELAEKVWQITFDCETNIVDVAIRRLRQKVDNGFAYPLVHTVRGVGYVLEKR